LQPYGYADDDPINAVDPLGFCSWNPFDSDSCEFAETGKFLTNAWNTTTTWFQLHGEQVALIGLGTILIVGGAVLTGGTLDVLLATGAELEASTFAGFAEGFDFWVHAPFALLPGLGTIAGGSYLIYQGAQGCGQR
jgi:hypothetical protein